MALTMIDSYREGYGIFKRSANAIMFGICGSIIVALGSFLGTRTLHLPESIENMLLLGNAGTYIPANNILFKVGLEWFKQNWLAASLLLIISAICALWFWAGQYGAMARVAKNETYQLSFFPNDANRIFGKLLFGFVIVAASYGGLGLVALGAMLIVGYMPTAIARGSLMVGLGMCVVFVVIWVTVRIALWKAVIALDGSDTVAAFESSFRSTSGYGLRIFGILFLIQTLWKILMLPLRWVHTVGTASYCLFTVQSVGQAAVSMFVFAALLSFYRNSEKS